MCILECTYIELEQEYWEHYASDPNPVKFYRKALTFFCKIMFLRYSCVSEHFAYLYDSLRLVRNLNPLRREKCYEFFLRVSFPGGSSTGTWSWRTSSWMPLATSRSWTLDCARNNIYIHTVCSIVHYQKLFTYTHTYIYFSNQTGIKYIEAEILT